MRDTFSTKERSVGFRLRVTIFFSTARLSFRIRARYTKMRGDRRIAAKERRYHPLTEIGKPSELASDDPQRS